MKKQLLVMIFFMISFLGLSMYARVSSDSDLIKTKREIPLKGGSKGKEDGSFRSPILQWASASIYDNKLSVEFLSSVANVTIIVINTSKDEVIHSVNYSMPAMVVIDLKTYSSNDYRVELTTDFSFLLGEFSF